MQVLKDAELEAAEAKRRALKESEADIRFRVIDPMLREGGWQPERILLERPYNAGQIVPEGRGGKRVPDSIKKPDYVLEYAQTSKLQLFYIIIKF